MHTIVVIEFVCEHYLLRGVYKNSTTYSATSINSNTSIALSLGSIGEKGMRGNPGPPGKMGLQGLYVCTYVCISHNIGCAPGF